MEYSFAFSENHGIIIVLRLIDASGRRIEKLIAARISWNGCRQNKKETAKRGQIATLFYFCMIL
jgi:hypothetical protein